MISLPLIQWQEGNQQPRSPDSLRPRQQRATIALVAIVGDRQAHFSSVIAGRWAPIWRNFYFLRYQFSPASVAVF